MKTCILEANWIEFSGSAIFKLFEGVKTVFFAMFFCVNLRRRIFRFKRICKDTGCRHKNRWGSDMYCFFKGILGRRVFLVACALALAGARTAAAADWSFAVYNVINGHRTPSQWVPLDRSRVTQRWKICALFPHLKDPYWLAANYGIVQEVRRDNLNFQLFHAKGYDDLKTQLVQMDKCIEQGMDAIILGAIHGDAVGAKIRLAVEKGIPVIDFSNGVNEPKISAHALVSFYDLGFQMAKYLVAKFDGEVPKIGFFPGPAGAKWSDDAVQGFNDGLQRSRAKIVVTRRADVSLSVQLTLIRNALKTNPEINFIVGVDVAAQAAAIATRSSQQTGTIKVLSLDIIPSVYQDILSGNSHASLVDFTVIQGRIAVDMAVRLLEKQPLPTTRSGQMPKMMTRENALGFDLETMFAPKDFKPVFKINAQ